MKIPEMGANATNRSYLVNMCVCGRKCGCVAGRVCVFYVVSDLQRRRESSVSQRLNNIAIFWEKE